VLTPGSGESVALLMFLAGAAPSFVLWLRQPAVAVVRWNDERVELWDGARLAQAIAWAGARVRTAEGYASSKVFRRRREWRLMQIVDGTTGESIAVAEGGPEDDIVVRRRLVTSSIEKLLGAATERGIVTSEPVDLARVSGRPHGWATHVGRAGYVGAVFAIGVLAPGVPSVATKVAWAASVLLSIRALPAARELVATLAARVDRHAEAPAALAEPRAAGAYRAGPAALATPTGPILPTRAALLIELATRLGFVALTAAASLRLGER
jgi:hypothetical protein